MNTWHTVITTRIAGIITGEALDDLVRALPLGSTAGRSPYGPELRVSLTLTADHPDQAVLASRVLVASVLAALGVEQLDDTCGIEVLRGDEYDRRLVVADARHDSGLPPMYSTKQAAELLGVTPGAIRQRAEGGTIPTRKVGDAGWVFPAAAIDALAAAKRRGEDI